MGIKIKKPVTIRVDNIGAIFIANNVTTSPRTKHIDVRYRFVNEFIEDGIIKIIFVKTEENDSDGFTKNLSGELHEKHKTKFIAERNEIENFHKNEMRDFDDDQVATGRVLRGVLRPDGGTDNTYGERGEYSRFALDTID